jgi:hypothetical protein
MGRVWDRKSARPGQRREKREHGWEGGVLPLGD